MEARVERWREEIMKSRRSIEKGRFGVRALAVIGAVVVILCSGIPGNLSASAAEMPKAVDDAFVASLGSAIQVAAPGILGNDTGVGSFAVTLLTSPLHGSVTGFGRPEPGAFTYKTTDKDYRGGMDTFTYCMSVALGTACVSNPATVSISVPPVVGIDDYYSTPAGVRLDVKTADSGVLANDQTVLNASFIDMPMHGSLDVVCAGVLPGTFCYTPTGAFVGADRFRYCLSIVAGNGCVSEPVTVTIRVGGPTVSRISGTDRFDVAAGVAEQTHPMGASTVFIASGGNYPDALSAAPAANHSGGALLLVTADAIPGRTQDALNRLAPSKVVIVGGPNTISESVASSLRSMLPGATVSRIGGADRFAVSRAVATTVFGTAAQAIVATGANYPDALSSGGAAAIVDEPVVLVNGGLAAADAETVSLLGTLGTTTLVISGGPNSVSTGVEASLRTIATVTRVGGTDRFEASVNINKASFTTATTAYLATGLNYPDALVGGVIAGKNRGPLYVVQTNCVPQATLDDIARIGATKVVLLGGPNSLSERVFNLVPCV